jgi:hypothetical protein
VIFAGLLAILCGYEVAAESFMTGLTNEPQPGQRICTSLLPE